MGTVLMQEGEEEMSEENITQALDRLVVSWYTRVRREEELIEAVEDSDKKLFMMGYIVGTLRAKWELQDVIREIEE